MIDYIVHFGDMGLSISSYFSLTECIHYSYVYMLFLMSVYHQLLLL